MKAPTTKMSDTDFEKLRELILDYGLIGMIKALARVCNHWVKMYEHDEKIAVQHWRRAESELLEIAKSLETQPEK